jgi:hypothetical protein
LRGNPEALGDHSQEMPMSPRVFLGSRFIVNARFEGGELGIHTRRHFSSHGADTLNVVDFVALKASRSDRIQ